MRSLVLIAAAAALVPAATFAGSVRSVTAPAPVLAVAFEGSRIAYAAGRSTTDCNRVYVWNLSTRSVTRLGRATHCEQTSTGNAVAAVSIAGTRVLWIHYAGGNLRDWTLWTATTGGPAPRLLRSVTTEADTPAPLVIGPGDVSRLGDLLPYAAGRQVVVLRSNGSRRFSWTAPARVVALAAGDGFLAVATAGGRVTLLNASGGVDRVETFDGEVSAVRVTSVGVVAQQGGKLEWRLANGSRTLTLPAGGRLEDAAADRAFLVVAGEARVIEYISGIQRPLGPGTKAQIEGARSAVSLGRRITLRPLP